MVSLIMLLMLLILLWLSLLPLNTSRIMIPARPVLRVGLISLTLSVLVPLILLTWHAILRVVPRVKNARSVVLRVHTHRPVVRNWPRYSFVISLILMSVLSRESLAPRCLLRARRPLVRPLVRLAGVVLNVHVLTVSVQISGVC